MYRSNATYTLNERKGDDESANSSRIKPSYMHMIFYAGLRGAVAYALASSFPDESGNRELVRSTTAAIVVLSVVLMGGTTEMLIYTMEIPTEIPINSTFEVRLNIKSI